MLAAGIYGGFGQRSLNQQNMQWSSQYSSSTGFDATLPSNEAMSFESLGYVDFGFGMNWSLIHNSSSLSSNDGLKINAGIGFGHVNKPDFDFIGNVDENLDMKIAAHARALIGLSGTNMALVPSVYFQIQGTQKEILPGFMLRYMLREQSHYTGFISDAYLSIGGMYRTSDALILNAMVEINDFALGMSYDINVSELSVATSGKGGFEFALRYTIPNSNKNKSFY
jgi:type IX secretion system PorP/SprF family membrane protein